MFAFSQWFYSPFKWLGFTKRARIVSRIKANNAQIEPRIVNERRYYQQ